METNVHLFLTCPYVSQVWYWMGECQERRSDWSSFDVVLTYAQGLSVNQCTAFLAVFSSVCWNIWKLRNNICFNAGSLQTVRNTIILTCSLLDFWAGKMKPEIVSKLAKWKPEDFDLIPLQCVAPLSNLTLTEEDDMVPELPLLAMEEG